MLTRVLVLEPDATMRLVGLPPHDARVAAMQEIVGGLLDVVSFGEADMWINDEGLYLCEFNLSATFIAMCHGLDHQPYFGTAIFATADEFGETRSLPDRLVRKYQTLVEEFHSDDYLLLRESLVGWARRFGG